MKKRWWYICLTTVLLLGLLAPWWMAMWNEARQSAYVAQAPVRQSLLAENRDWSFWQRLRSASLTMASRATDHIGAMDAEEAEKTGRETLEQLEQAGVLTEALPWELDRCEFYLMIGRNTAVISNEDQIGTFYAWLCGFLEPATGSRIGLLIDDETGLLLAGGLLQGDGTAAPWIDRETGMSTALRFAVFCEESYGVSLQSIEMAEEGDAALTAYTLIFENGMGETLSLPLYEREKALKFQAMIGFY